MAVKVIKGQICSGTTSEILCHLEYTICVESFILVSKSAYKAPILALCRSTNTKFYRNKWLEL